MDNSSDDDCITVKVVDESSAGWERGLVSVFIKREGRDPTLRDLSHEITKAGTAYRK